MSGNRKPYYRRRPHAGSKVPGRWLTDGVDPNSLSEHTVDNDRWDRQDLGDMKKEVKDFAAARQALGKFADTGDDALEDAFFMLLKADPHLLPPDEIKPGNMVNRRIMETAAGLDEMDRLRRYTVNDDVAAAMGCVEIEPELETLFDQTDQARKEAMELQNKLAALHKAQQDQFDLDDVIRRWTEDQDNLTPESCPTCDGTGEVPVPQDDEGQGQDGGDEDGEGQNAGQGEGQDGEGEGQDGEGQGQGRGQGEGQGQGDQPGQGHNPGGTAPCPTCAGTGAGPGQPGGDGEGQGQPSGQPGQGGGEGQANGPGRPEELTPEQREQLDNFAKQQRELGEKIEELQRQAEAQNETFEEAMDRSRATMHQGLAKMLDGAATNAEKIAETAMTWGVSPGQMQSMDPQQRIELARKLNSERFRRIADLFGPMRNLMMSEQKRRTVHTTEEIYDIEIGSSLNRLVPSELLALAGAYSHEDALVEYEKYVALTKADGETPIPFDEWETEAIELAEAQELDFMRKFQEHALMQYAMQGEEKLARGGIIVCEDGSGSMSGERELWAKAIMLCLLHLARQQKRSFRLIHFGSPGQVRIIEFTEPGHFTMDRIMDAAELFFGGGPLRVDQRIATPDGWKPIGDAQVGDRVFGPDGKPTEIIGVYPQGELDLYEVTFRDGAKVICDGTHIWTVQDKTTGNPEYVDMTLNDMIAKGFVYNHKAGSRYNFSVPVSSPIVLDEADLPLHPYLMGYLLGDGTLGGGRSVSVHSSESEHPWRDVLPEGVEVTVYSEPTSDRCGSYGFKGTQVLDAITELGLLGVRGENKFVPEVYLWGSIDQRLDLLSGLLDSDGNTVGNGGFEFSNTSLPLCEAVVHLAQSLGGVASLLTATVRDNEKPLWKVKGRVDSNLPAPFRLTRKIDSYVVHANQYMRSIVSAERVETAEAICIKVDRIDGLFLTEGMVVTHNTDFATPMRNALGFLQDDFARTGEVRADVVFVTDDECYVDDAFMTEYLEEMDRMRATTWGIAVAGGPVREGALNSMTKGKVATIKDITSGDDVREIFRGV